MTEDEKRAILQFMGTVYGESKKNDQMLVGSSTNLRPKSEEIKNTFDRTLRTPTVNEPLRQIQQAPIQNPEQVAPAPPQEPALTPEPVSVEQAAQELAAIVAEPVQEVVAPVKDEAQFEFDFSEPTKMDKLVDNSDRQIRELVMIRKSLESLVSELHKLNSKPTSVQSNRNGSRPKNNQSK